MAQVEGSTVPLDHGYPRNLPVKTQIKKCQKKGSTKIIIRQWKGVFSLATDVIWRNQVQLNTNQEIGLTAGSVKIIKEFIIEHSQQPSVMTIFSLRWSPLDQMDVK